VAQWRDLGLDASALKALVVPLIKVKVVPQGPRLVGCELAVGLDEVVID
jgi:hypothetical protein